MQSVGTDSDLADIVARLGHPRVLVVGDAMLDRYVWGDAARISQEAPVILLQADRKEERLGGASSVATMLRALGARVVLAGVVGNDVDGKRLRKLVTDLGIDDEALLGDATRPTTVKERYIGRAQHRHPQQMIRVDYEVRTPLESRLEDDLIRIIEHQIHRVDLVLISDYDKGVCTPGLLRRVIASARRQGVKIVADPIRSHDYSKYHGCSAMTPNRLEGGLATKQTITTIPEAFAAAETLQRTLDLEAGIVTLDRDGMVLVHRDGRRGHYPTRPRQVYDITGAGDMVMAALGLALAAGIDYPQAIRLGNVAGGLEVEKIGVATVTREEMLADIRQASVRGKPKLLSRAELASELDRHRAIGRRIAFTNGCFDVLHAGHVQYLYEARAQGDLLVVAFNSDESVRRLKGPTRPINAAAARALVLSALEPVDYLTIFDEPTPLALIELVRPDVLIKGADYKKEAVVGGDFVESYGGRVHLAHLREGYSTTGVLERLRAA